jgi:hypothetical protein
VATVYCPLFAAHCLLPNVYYPLFTVDFLRPTLNCLLFPAHSLLSSLYFPLFTAHSLPAHCSLSTVNCQLFTAHCILHAHCLLPTVYRPLLTAHFLLSTAHYPLPTVLCLLHFVHCPLSTVHAVYLLHLLISFLTRRHLLENSLDLHLLDIDYVSAADRQWDSGL